MAVAPWFILKGVTYVTLPVADVRKLLAGFGFDDPTHDEYETWGRISAILEEAP